VRAPLPQWAMMWHSRCSNDGGNPVRRYAWAAAPTTSSSLQHLLEVLLIQVGGVGGADGRALAPVALAALGGLTMICGGSSWQLAVVNQPVDALLI